MTNLLDFLYPISYLLSLGSLVSWFFLQGRRNYGKLASTTFLAAFFIYLACLSWSSGTTSYKLLILFRDMAVMTVISQLFNIARRSVVLSLAFAAAAIATVYVSYFSILQYTFPQLQTEQLEKEAEFILHLADGSKIKELNEIAKVHNLKIAPAFHMQSPQSTQLDDYLLVDLPETGKMKKRMIFRKIAELEAVDWIEPNEQIFIDYPGETQLSEVQLQDPVLNDPGLNRQWAYKSMEMNTMHRELLKSGIQPVRKASLFIIDSGVDAGHEDLTGNYISLDPKHDTDPIGHGTHCAGIAGAVSNNEIGIASYGPSTEFVELTSIRVANSIGVITQKAIIQAILDAVDAGADVINLSLGGPSNQKKQKAYNEAVLYAAEKGCIIVVAAGNQSSDARGTAPANAQGVIAVAAVDEQLNKAVFSNRINKLKMGIAAPGVNIYSTLPENKYGALNGTSMAAPQVSGLLALMKSFYPDLTTKEAFYILQKTGRKLRDSEEVGRFIQPEAAIRELID